MRVWLRYLPNLHILAALAAVIPLVGCGSTPEYKVNVGQACGGLAYRGEGMFLNGGLIEGKITMGTNEPGAFVWEGRNDFPLMHGTMKWADGRRFQGTMRATVANNCSTYAYVHGADTRLDGCTYEGSFKNQALWGPGKISCPDRTQEGEFKADVLNGRGTISWAKGERLEAEFSSGRAQGWARFTYADGRQLSVRYVNGLRQGDGDLQHPSGDRDTLVYDRGLLLLEKPYQRKTSLPSCASLPSGWLLLKGSCADGKLEGEVRLWQPSTGHQIRSSFAGGVPDPVSILVWSSGEPSVVHRVRGSMDAQLRFSEGTHSIARADQEGKTVIWYWDWQGPYVNGQAQGTGTCGYEGKAEPCEMVAGRRVDPLHQERERRAAAQAQADREAAMRTAIALEQLEASRERDRAERQREREDYERARAAEPVRRTVIGGGSASVFSPEASAKMAREFQAMADSNARMLAQVAAAKQQLERETAAQQRSAGDEAARRARETQARAQANKQEQDRLAAERARLAQTQAQEEARARALREEQAAERQAAASREAERRAAERAAAQRAVPASVTVPEAVAVCHRNAQEHWFCDGPVQKTSVGEKGDAGLHSQLALAGCASPRAERGSPDGQGKLFLCAIGLKPGARDVAKLRGFVTPRQTYRCQGGDCSALADSRELSQ